MDPKAVIETGKATAEFLKAVLEFIGSKGIGKSESNRLMSFYLAIQAYMEVQDDYFLFLEELPNTNDDRFTLLWQAKKLSHLMATRHFEAYNLVNGLDFSVRAHEHTLHDLIKVYKTRVSGSLGFGPKDVAVASAYKSIAAMSLKRKHLLATYKIDEIQGKFYVGELIVGDNSAYSDFIDLHKSSIPFMKALMDELDIAVAKLVKIPDR